MKQSDSNFTVNDFLAGSKYAYEMILMAFENGNIDDVRDFISEEIEDVFDQVIEDRKSKGLVIEAEYLGTRAIARFHLKTRHLGHFCRRLDARLDHDLGDLEIVLHEVGTRLFRKLDAD